MRTTAVSLALIAALMAAILVLAVGCGGGGGPVKDKFPAGVVWDAGGLVASDKATSATGWVLKLALQGEWVTDISVVRPDGSDSGDFPVAVDFAPNKVTSLALTSFTLADLQAGGKGAYYTLIQNGEIWVNSKEAENAGGKWWASAGSATGYVAAQVMTSKNEDTVVLTKDGKFVDEVRKLPDFSQTP